MLCIKNQQLLFKIYTGADQKSNKTMSIVKDLAILQYLTDTLITQKGVSAALNFTTGAINNRIIRGGNFKPEEKKELENFYGISFADFKESTPNTYERQNDETVYERLSQFGKRLQEIQDKHNFLNREMAQLLKISERQYAQLKVGKMEPTISILNELKRNFVVDIDWLMYGE